MSDFQNTVVCPQAFPHLRTQSPRNACYAVYARDKGHIVMVSSYIYIYIYIYIYKGLCLYPSAFNQITFCQQIFRCNKRCNTTTTTNNRFIQVIQMNIHAFPFPSVSVAHYRLVNQIHSARIRLVLARLGIVCYPTHLGVLLNTPSGIN